MVSGTDNESEFSFVKTADKNNLSKENAASGYGGMPPFFYYQRLSGLNDTFFYP